MLRDSTVNEKWLAANIESNPPSAILDQDGQPTGRFTTGPVRLAFPNLHTPRADDNGVEKYDVVAMWPPGVDMTAFKQELDDLRRGAKLSNKSNLRMPFRQQDEKAEQYSGFTPGALFCTVRSKFQPQIVDSSMETIRDEKRVYGGVWAILAVHFFAYDNRGNAGVGIGLDSVMIIADDKQLDGGGASPEQAFGAVKVSEPIASPGAAFGQAGPDEGDDDNYGGLL